MATKTFPSPERLSTLTDAIVVCWLVAWCSLYSLSSEREMICYCPNKLVVLRGVYSLRKVYMLCVITLNAVPKAEAQAFE